MGATYLIIAVTLLLLAVCWRVLRRPAWTEEDLQSALAKMDARVRYPKAYIPLTGPELAALTAHSATMLQIRG